MRALIIVLDSVGCGNAPDAALKRWKQTILTSEEPAAVHRLLDDAYDDFAWSAAA